MRKVLQVTEGKLEDEENEELLRVTNLRVTSYQENEESGGEENFQQLDMIDSSRRKRSLAVHQQSFARSEVI